MLWPSTAWYTTVIPEKLPRDATSTLTLSNPGRNWYSDRGSQLVNPSCKTQHVMMVMIMALWLPGRRVIARWAAYLEIRVECHRGRHSRPTVPKNKKCDEPLNLNVHESKQANKCQPYVWFYHPRLLLKCSGYECRTEKTSHKYVSS